MPAAGQIRIAQMEREFLFQPVGREKVEYLGRSSVCSRKFPLKPEILPEWKAPQVLLKGFAITIRMNGKINDCVVAQIT